MTSWWVQQISDGNYVPKYHGSIGCLVPVVNVKILEKCPNSHQIAKLNDTLVSFSSFHLKKKNKIIWYQCHKSVDTMLQCKTYLHRQSGRRGKKLLCRPKRLRLKMMLTHTCAKNRHSLRKKNISRVGGRSNALPQFYVGGRVRIKVLSKRKLWVLWSVFRVTRKQSCCNSFKNCFLYN